MRKFLFYFLLAALLPGAGFASAPAPARPPLWSRIGTSLAHGATALRYGYAAVVQGFSLATCTVSATGTVNVTLFSFTNRAPFPSPNPVTVSTTNHP